MLPQKFLGIRYMQWSVAGGALTGCFDVRDLRHAGSEACEVLQVLGT
jgi:hypothetical protein